MPSTAHTLLQITVNGEQRQVAATTIAALVAELNLDTRQVAIECNLAIVPRSQHGVTPILAGDRIEIVGFIGGG